MALLPEFDSYYRQTLFPELSRVEALRIEAARKFERDRVIGYTLGFGIFIGCMGFFLTELPQLAEIGVGGLFFVRAAHLQRRPLSEPVWARYKHDIVPLLLSAVHDRFTLDPQDSFSREDYVTSGLTQRKIKAFRSKGVASISLPATTLRMGVVEVATKNWNWEAAPFFHGLMVEFTLPRAHPGKTVVLAEKSLKATLALADGFGSRVSVGDPAFAQRFAVASDRPDEARTLLNEPARRHLNDLRDRTDQAIRLSVVGDRVTMTLACGAIFEPKIEQSLLSFARLRDFCETVALVVALAEAMASPSERANPDAEPLSDLSGIGLPRAT